MPSARRALPQLNRFVLLDSYVFRAATSNPSLKKDGNPDCIAGTENQSRTFTFRSGLTGLKSVNLGSRLSPTFVSLPCEVVLSNSERSNSWHHGDFWDEDISPVTSAHTESTHCRHSEQGDIASGSNVESYLERITANGIELRSTIFS
jgi:hypothetical protein